MADTWAAHLTPNLAPASLTLEQLEADMAMLLPTVQIVPLVQLSHIQKVSGPDPQTFVAHHIAWASSRAPPPHHPGIQYHDLVPGMEHFVCLRLSAKLSSASCASMWLEGNRGVRGELSERRVLCRCCPVGASHAGVANASLSPIMGALLCARCFRPCSRLIHSNLCVSCYNREREYMRGKNARGRRPIKLSILMPRQITYAAAGRVHVIRAERSKSSDELIVGALRDSRFHVRFAWRSLPAGLRQMRLF